MLELLEVKGTTDLQICQEDTPLYGLYSTCGPKGYGFSAVLVINRVSILVINRVMIFFFAFDLN